MRFECARSPRKSHDLVMMIEIVPGITMDSERMFGRPVIAGTRVTAEHQLTAEQFRAVLRYAVALAEQNLDATFAALWADPIAMPPKRRSIVAPTPRSMRARGSEAPSTS
jgi:uncharacterized protein (DUF433 family)